MFFSLFALRKCRELESEIGGLAIDFLILVADMPWAEFFFAVHRAPERPTCLAFVGGQVFVFGGARSIVIFCVERGPQSGLLRGALFCVELGPLFFVWS